MAVEGEIEKVPLDVKIKMEKRAKEDLSVLNPATFDTIDALAGVFSFVMKEVCEHMGIVQNEGKKGKSNNDKVLGFTEKKIEFFNGKQDKFLNISKKYNIPQQ